MTEEPRPAAEEEPYLETTDVAYSTESAETLTVTRERDGGLLIAGPCPRCDHLFKNVWYDKVFKRSAGSGAVDVDSRSGSDSTIPLVCWCDTQHPGTPEGLVGCGAYWKVEVT